MMMRCSTSAGGEVHVSITNPAVAIPDFRLKNPQNLFRFYLGQSISLRKSFARIHNYRLLP